MLPWAVLNFAFRITRKERVYINATLKKKATDVVKLLGGEELSAAGSIENIIEHRLKTYLDEINRLHHKSRRDISYILIV